MPLEEEGATPEPDVIAEVYSSWEEEQRRLAYEDDELMALENDMGVSAGADCGSGDDEDRIEVPRECVKEASIVFCVHSDANPGGFFEGLSGADIHPGSTDRRRGWSGHLQAGSRMRREVSCDGFNFLFGSAMLQEGDPSGSCDDAFAQLLEECTKDGKVAAEASLGTSTNKFDWTIHDAPSREDGGDDEDDQGQDDNDGDDDTGGDDNGDQGGHETGSDAPDPRYITNGDNMRYWSDRYQGIPIEAGEWECTLQVSSSQSGSFTTSTSECKCAARDGPTIFTDSAGCMDSECEDVSACRPWRIACSRRECDADDGGDCVHCQEVAQ